ncbi:MAG: right-handed parallel beta-helix repeat-containing protein [Fibrobacter sp.]|nr:right-handed parallel beta-helix repeat-containing protein [Fibrobacter sp.]
MLNFARILRNSYLRYVSVAGLLLGAVACSNNTDEELAGGTEAESTIALQVQLADGKPAARTRVRILPDSYLSDGMDSLQWAETDENGRIEFANMESGSYMVEARRVEKSKASGAVLGLDFVEGQGSVVDTVSLEKLSTIEGFVATGQGPSVIRIPGLDRFVVPDSTGHFVLDSLPPGDFEVYVESRSNRGSVKILASSGEKVPAMNLGSTRGFLAENFESLDGRSATGEFLGDGWWYTMGEEDERLLPLLDSSLVKKYFGRAECASGGCARVTDKLGFMLGLYKTDYKISELDTLMFSARGSGKLTISLFYGDSNETQKGRSYEVKLSKVWQGYAIATSEMKTFGGAGSSLIVSRVEFSVSNGDTAFVDDVLLGGVNESVLKSVAVANEKERSAYPTDWNDHDALLKQVTGYASGIRGGAGVVGSTENEGEICVVTTTEDYLFVEDTSYIDDTTMVVSVTAEHVPGSLRECAYREGPTWIVFENSGTYELLNPLRIKPNKTIDGRGRNIRITGLGIATDSTYNLIFENITFTDPAITSQDSLSRRALSVHNRSDYVWMDHCTFEEYPLVEVDVKRNSDHVTISWSKFNNAETAILFGLEPDRTKEDSQRLTLHHNYFVNLSYNGMYARGGKLHAYNNFFDNIERTGIECTDSAYCYIENNIFNIETPVIPYRKTDDDGVPVDSTRGSVLMQGDWFVNGGEELEGHARGYVPSYKVSVDEADIDLMWKIKEQAGPR